ncbi:DUF3137 domain-containing protein [Teredinibacter sp. KSP-S5-2]|uniref:DUF3137 domain-containing protein n=1 Tax=Teredinibacter sp. KSP-S5-2 TaxID=3034506 RepID=UPI0029352A6D|nr:DUF3137 domain-containing protein [Teredinibacter sp. KSP-S5-2]WNO08297.1 DUF3137 domain-containing protein [Teredinibacter sp. KSP-S5-2]
MELLQLLLRRDRRASPATGVFEEQAPYEKGFANHYETHIKPLAMEYEEKRRAAIDKANVRLKVTLAVLVGVTTLVHTLQEEGNWPIAIIFSLIFTYGVMNPWVVRPLKEYKTSIKDQVFPKILSFLGEFEYRSSCSDTVMQWSNTGLIPSYNREINEDAIYGLYKGVMLNLFESHLKNERGSGKDRREVTVFKGIVIDIDMNKPFQGKTILRKDRGKVRNWLKRTFDRMDRVVLEDPKFESIFEVYSTDQIEARYLLTPAFMERINSLVERMEGEGIQCCFLSEKLFMMIPLTKNMFEPGSVFESEDFVDDAKSLLADMNDIFSIVEILKLNQSTRL